MRLPARFVPEFVDALEIAGPFAETDRRVGQIWLLEARRIILYRDTGRDIDPQPLAGAAESLPFANVLPTLGPARDVEVLLVDHDVADEPGVGIDAHAEAELARLGFGRVDIDAQLRVNVDKVLHSLIGRWIRIRHQWCAAGRPQIRRLRDTRLRRSNEARLRLHITGWRVCVTGLWLGRIHRRRQHARHTWRRLILNLREARRAVGRVLGGCNAGLRRLHLTVGIVDRPHGSRIGIGPLHRHPPAGAGRG